MNLVVRFTTLALVTATSFAAPSSQPATRESGQKNGLQATLLLDETHFAKNEPIRFKVRFKNLSGKALSLQDADDFGNWVIRLQDIKSQMPWRLQRIVTGQPEPVQTARELPPGKTLDVKTDWGSSQFPFRYESELITDMPILPVDALAPGRYQLWVSIDLKRSPNREQAHRAFRGDINLGPAEIWITNRTDPNATQVSEPVQENNADFQAVAPGRWVEPTAGAKTEIPLGIKVTNRTGRSMQINAMNTFRVVLKDSSGAELPCVTEKAKATLSDPLILQAREGQTLRCNAVLQQSQDGNSLSLSGSEGSGNLWHFDGLKAGNYTMHLIFECKSDNPQPVPAQHVIDPKEVPFWTGNVTTQEVAVKISTKKAGTLHSMKGWELYMWRDGEKKFYSLVVGTNRSKGDDEIKTQAVEGVEAIKAKLDQLKEDEGIVLLGRSEGKEPPKVDADEISAYCKKIGLRSS